MTTNKDPSITDAQDSLSSLGLVSRSNFSEYNLLRRRQRKVGLIFFPIFFIPLAMKILEVKIRHAFVAPCFILPLLAICLTWLVAYVSLGVKLMRWRCPRCGKRPYSNTYLTECPACGLSADPQLNNCADRE